MVQATYNEIQVQFRVRDCNSSTFEVSKRPKDVQIAISNTDGRTVYAYLTLEQYRLFIMSEVAMLTEKGASNAQ